MIAGLVLYNIGHDTIYGIGGEVIQLQTNTLGYAGIGLAAASYILLLIEPFYFVARWNQELYVASDLPRP